MRRAADEARRRNAGKSTGPRTIAGKRRSAKNALRHGLSIPLHLDPEEKARIQTLADHIAADTHDGGVRALVEQIAEAQLEIIRARNMRQKLLTENVDVANRSKIKDFREITPGAKSIEHIETTSNRLTENAENGVVEHPYLSVAEKISILAGELARIDRYERRALSRRKFLIRDYDALCAARIAEG